jgi:hypothetical protein
MGHRAPRGPKSKIWGQNRTEILKFLSQVFSRRLTMKMLMARCLGGHTLRGEEGAGHVCGLSPHGGASRCLPAGHACGSGLRGPRGARHACGPRPHGRFKARLAAAHTRGLNLRALRPCKNSCKKGWEAHVAATQADPPGPQGPKSCRGIRRFPCLLKGAERFGKVCEDVSRLNQVFCAGKPKFSGAWFRSMDLWVMSPTR